ACGARAKQKERLLATRRVSEEISWKRRHSTLHGKAGISTDKKNGKRSSSHKPHGKEESRRGTPPPSSVSGQRWVLRDLRHHNREPAPCSHCRCSQRRWCWCAPLFCPPGRRRWGRMTTAPPTTWAS
ncbi:unnamed protein product, partial [Ectocarpus sp. 8 AP-2014]